MSALRGHRSNPPRHQRGVATILVLLLLGLVVGTRQVAR